MAHMYIKDGKFRPFDNLGDNLADLDRSPEDGFEVDTLLAYPISILNNKGYMTEMCCEGHPLPVPYYESADEYKKKKLEDYSDCDRVFEVRENEEGKKYICFEGDPDVETLVIFQKGIKLQSVPEGWEYEEEGNIIRWDCGHYDNPTEYYKKLIIAIEALTTWAERMNVVSNAL